MKTFAPLLLALSLPALAGPAEGPFYGRLGTLIPQDSFRVFLGGKAATIPTLELGWTLPLEAGQTSLNVHVGYFDAKGRAINQYGGLRHHLKAMNLGADVRWQTPVQPLKFYLGLTLNRFDGQRETGGVLRNPSNVNTAPIILQPGPLKETKAKLGYRMGFEWAFSQHWGATLDYSLAEWISRATTATSKPDTGQYAYTGVNPVQPHYFTLAAQFRF